MKPEPLIGMTVRKWGHTYKVASIKVGPGGPHVRLSGDGPDADGSLVHWSRCEVVGDAKH